MRKTSFIFTALALLMVSCNSNSNKQNAIGLFEQTEVLVSAENVGNIVYLNATEGQQIFKDSVIGLIDTTILGLQKMELIIERDTAMSIRTKITKKIADIEKQISWQKTEKIRFENLVALNSATRKQVDETNNTISDLEKQLASEHILLEKTNTELIDKSIAFGQEISKVEDQIRKCKISSPIDGTLLVKYSKAGDMMNVGKPIFSVIDKNSIFLKAYITPEIKEQIYQNQEVSISAEGREYNGIITWISEASEPTPDNIKSKSKVGDTSFAIKISIPNDGTLKKGMYGEAKLKGISISK